MYRQCKLETIEGSRSYTCWLPLKYAVKGKRLIVEPMVHTTWIVKMVYREALTGKQIKMYSSQYKTHRNITDV